MRHVKFILKVIKLLLSVDVEKGYSTSEKAIVENTLKLAQLGCAKINIADSTHIGELLPPEKFANIIDKIKPALIANRFPVFVINAKTDIYLTKDITDKVKYTQLRESIYKDAGANCLFVPGLTSSGEISMSSKATTLPQNVLNLPGKAGGADDQKRTLYQAFYIFYTTLFLLIKIKKGMFISWTINNIDRHTFSPYQYSGCDKEMLCPLESYPILNFCMYLRPSSSAKAMLVPSKS